MEKIPEVPFNFEGIGPAYHDGPNILRVDSHKKPLTLKTLAPLKGYRLNILDVRGIMTREKLPVLREFLDNARGSMTVGDVVVDPTLYHLEVFTPQAEMLAELPGSICFRLRGSCNHFNTLLDLLEKLLPLA